MKTEILYALLPKLNQRMSSFIRKHPDLGIIYNVGEPFKVEIKHRKVQVVEVEVEAKSKIEGWEFVAALDYDAIIKRNIVRRNPEFKDEIPAEYFTRCTCDHCKKQVNRVHTTLMRNQNGEFKQVGNACVKEFIGVDVSNYLAYLSLFDELKNEEEFDDFDFRSNKIETWFDLQDVIEQTIEEVKARGYTSKKDAEEKDRRSTASRIYALMNEIEVPNKYHEYELDVPRYNVSEETKQKAKDIIEYWNRIKITNDYTNNCQFLTVISDIKNNQLGLAASMVPSYYNAVEKAKEIEAKQQNNKSEFVGSIGDRIEFKEVTLIRKTAYETEFGFVFVYEILNENNVLVWKTSNLIDDGIYNLRGTVKKQTVYNGIKQTELTRCKIM